ncbi:MAG: low molecular weight phosphatase family protein [Leucobacter sp.]
MAFDLFDSAPQEGPFTVLTVCTGNICRSPLAEMLLQKALHGLPVNVRSAGTRALTGSPMTEQNQIIAEELGVVDPTSHRARQLTSDDLRSADLVLALSRQHRREVVELLPRASRTAFTLREFARLAAAHSPNTFAQQQLQDPGARLRATVTSIAQLRGSALPPADPVDDDVIDPYQQPDEVYAHSAARIIPAVNATAAVLRSALAQGR